MSDQRDTQTSPGEVTRLLEQAGQGDDRALGDLLPLVYEELRALASAFLRQERLDHTLQPTALVHEAYLRLVEQHKQDWKSKRHFMAIAGTAMRRVLVNHARGRGRIKRGGGRQRRDMDDVLASLAAGEEDLDLEAIDAALTRLAEVDERKVRVVELKFFVGLPIEEIADVLEVSPATVKRDWELARAWLLREITSDG